MTSITVSDLQPDLQPSSVACAPPRSGRRAFGWQRRMSPDIIARNIAESICAHRQLGDERPISFYTLDPDTQTRVQAKLEAMALAADAAMDDMATPPDHLGKP